MAGKNTQNQTSQGVDSLGTDAKSPKVHPGKVNPWGKQVTVDLPDQSYEGRSEEEAKQAYQVTRSSRPEHPRWHGRPESSVVTTARETGVERYELRLTSKGNLLPSTVNVTGKLTAVQQRAGDPGHRAAASNRRRKKSKRKLRSHRRKHKNPGREDPGHIGQPCRAVGES